jgi:hypothetical protein
VVYFGVVPVRGRVGVEDAFAYDVEDVRLQLIVPPFQSGLDEFVVGRAADDFYGEGLELAAIDSDV